MIRYHHLPPPRRRTLLPPATSLRALASLLWVGLLFATPARSADPAADGLYARIQTTLGQFWCRLEYQRVPRTVASFVSLAEGTRDWIDFTNARIVRRPFYNGVTFHRVIDEFMVQTGSPNGRGTDGPGYRFADEFHSALAHSRPGMLSMANSGEDTNGSQFFVTVTNTPWLDGIHTVFGEVVDGMDVVYSISKVPTDTSDKPVTPVVIQDVTILRIGTAAQAFNPAAVQPPLPDVGVVPVALLHSPKQGDAAEQLNLRMQSRPTHLIYAFFGPDLQTWNQQTFNSGATNIGAASLLGRPSMFFRVLDGGYDP